MDEKGGRERLIGYCRFVRPIAGRQASTAEGACS